MYMLSRYLYLLFLLIDITSFSSSFFFFNDTATTEIYTLSLHDALPICRRCSNARNWCAARAGGRSSASGTDRKSTRLNSSHLVISYAVFCLKKKKKEQIINESTRSSPVPSYKLTDDQAAELQEK